MASAVATGKQATKDIIMGMIHSTEACTMVEKDKEQQRATLENQEGSGTPEAATMVYLTIRKGQEPSVVVVDTAAAAVLHTPEHQGFPLVTAATELYC
jgi:hypothetical protein